MTPTEKRLSTLLKKRNATIIALERELERRTECVSDLNAALLERERSIELLRQSGPPLSRKSVTEIANRMVRAITTKAPDDAR